MLLFAGALSGEAAYNGLAEAGFITRWFSGFGQGVRITIGTAEQMESIAAILRDLAEAAR
jgi:histidinol-phosphate aminotransferase